MPPVADRKQLCVVGSLNADFVVRAPRFPRPGETVRGSSFTRFPGGKGGNQACAAARLAGPDLAVTMVGQVGADADGAWLREALAAEGVDVGGVATAEQAGTGVAVIAVDGAGQNQIVAVGGANEAFTPAELTPHHERMAGAHVLLLQLEIPLPTVQTAARVGREKGAIVILDPAPARSLPDGLLRLCDYVTPNESELCALDGVDPPSGALDRTTAAQAARRLLVRGARRVLVKLGAKGALLVTPEGQHFWPALPVAVVDTTAAGDAFNAAFAVALAEGKTPEAAGDFATVAAALCIGRQGAQPSLPTRAEVAAFGTPAPAP
jgi:ribokinase